ncbi:MAG: isoprenylcysteine carboxylmethyltransferase family protein [bacterium]|nr:isoprenylcysteine carboxylmethyltransferase family protein [bacterium]
MQIILIAGLAVYFSVKWMLYFAIEKHTNNIRTWILDGGVVLFFCLQLFVGFGVSKHVPLWASCAGVALFLAGVLIASYSRLLLAENYRAAAVMEAPNRLIVRGVYRFVRNPIYTGTLFVGCGIELVFFSPFFFLNIFSVLAFIYQVRKEEKVLQNAFPGEWAMFTKKTPYRLLPFVY